MLDALVWFVSAGRVDQALRLANALVPFWMATKRIDEGDVAFARALAIDGGEAGRRGLALAEYGYLIFWSGDDGIDHRHPEALSVTLAALNRYPGCAATPLVVVASPPALIDPRALPVGQAHLCFRRDVCPS